MFLETVRICVYTAGVEVRPDSGSRAADTVCFVLDPESPPCTCRVALSRGGVPGPRGKGPPPPTALLPGAQGLPFPKAQSWPSPPARCTGTCRHGAHDSHTEPELFGSRRVVTES